MQRQMNTWEGGMKEERVRATKSRRQGRGRKEGRKGIGREKGRQGGEQGGRDERRLERKEMVNDEHD